MRIPICLRVSRETVPIKARSSFDLESLELKEPDAKRAVIIGVSVIKTGAQVDKGSQAKPIVKSSNIFDGRATNGMKPKLYSPPTPI